MKESYTFALTQNRKKKTLVATQVEEELNIEIAFKETFSFLGQKVKDSS